MLIVVVLRYFLFAENKIWRLRAGKLYSEGMTINRGIDRFAGRVVKHLVVEVAHIAKSVGEPVLFQKDPSHRNVSNKKHLRLPLPFIFDKANRYEPGAAGSGLSLGTGSVV